VKVRSKGLVVAGVVLLVAGCAQPRYQFFKDGSTQREFSQDDAACGVQTSNVQMADWEYRGTIMEGANIKSKQQQVYLACMTAKGYDRRQVQ
jgi:hypothetical protein